MTRALYIGRFQLVHAGHLDVLRHIDAAPDIDEIVVAVGSIQYDHRAKSPAATWAANPFTWEERREMLERSLDGELRKPWSVVGVPDYHDWERWYGHLRDQLPAFHVLYTSDAEERDFFAARGVSVRPFPRRFAFHAGLLRRRIADGEDVRQVLARGTLAVLSRIDAVGRLREAFERDSRGAA